MQDHYIYDYAVIRIVPNVEREEFINVGVILSCPGKKFLDARIELDEERIKSFAPGFDIEITRKHLVAIQATCDGREEAGEIGKLSQRERFYWLTSPRSTIIQTSPVHSGYCKHPDEELIHLVEKMVRI